MADVVVWGVEYEFLRFLVQYCGLVLCILLLVCVVGGGCCKVFDKLNYTEDDRIIVLQYLMLVLLVSLVLNRIF